MATSARTETSRNRARRGLRLIQIWVPDTNSSDFAAEAHRQSAAVAASPYEMDDQDFIDAIARR